MKTTFLKVYRWFVDNNDSLNFLVACILFINEVVKTSFNVETPFAIMMFVCFYLWSSTRKLTRELKNSNGQ